MQNIARLEENVAENRAKLLAFESAAKRSN